MAKKAKSVIPQEMTADEQVQELVSKLMKIADKLRGKVDAALFKDYILGMLFYRYLSEQTVEYIEQELLIGESKTYEEAINDHEYNASIASIFENDEKAQGFEPSYSGLVKYWSTDHLGYVIEPDNLFSRLYERSLIKVSRAENEDKFSVDHLAKALKSLVKSTEGRDSEPAFHNLFKEVLDYDRLGNSVEEQSEKMAQLIVDIGQLSFGIKDAKIDILGTAYMELIGKFASSAGKKAGEFFTPISASKLLAKLATVGLEEAKYICDPAAGSGSLLLQVNNALPKHKVNHYYAQEYVDSTYSLLRMNLLLHGIPHSQFTAYNDDTLNHDNFYDENGKLIKFTVQVANPPFSADWKADIGLENDPRYKGGGLPDKRFGEIGFVEHMAYHMDDDGRIAVILPPGVTTRKEEYSMRKYFISKNYVDAIISLPLNMFHTTDLPVIIMILKKNRNGNADNVFFLDASKEYTRGRPKNYMTDEQIDRVVHAYMERKDVQYCSIRVPVEQIANEKTNNYILNINRYLPKKRDYINIDVEEKQSELIELNQAVADSNKRLQQWLGSDLMQTFRFTQDNGDIYPDWHDDKLSSFFMKVKTKNKDGEITNVLTNSARHGLIPQSYYFDKDIANTDKTDNYFVVETGNFVYNPRTSKDAPCGPIRVYELPDTGVVSPLYKVFKPIKDIYTLYWKYYFQSSYWNPYIIKNSGKGARHDRFSVKDPDFFSMPVIFPESLEEQQKIAEFFSDIDECIELEEKRLRVLKELKKGLLQKMFKK